VKPLRKGRPLFDRLALIGIGLIGSSIARAVKAKGLARTVVCTSRSRTTRERVRALRLVDAVAPTPAKAVERADLVIVCVPLGAYGDIARAIAGKLKRGAILSDVGSCKQSVLRDLKPAARPGVHFIPAHPVAGTEHSGPDAGFAELFEGRWCILTPPKGTDRRAVNKLKAFWRALGGHVEVMDARHHDLVLAITSHVPHLIAYNIVGTADELRAVTKSEVVKYAAGGFRDFTRIAASDPVMWRDIFLNNRDAVLEMLGRFVEDLTAVQRAIRWRDGPMLFDLFTRTRAIRRAVIAAGQADNPPPATKARTAKSRTGQDKAARLAR
jgi:cyclohexadieny/prephenate dehydrogenase